MGICFSSKSSSSPAFDCVRIVHLNGYVEDFDAPITVKQVSGSHPKHYVCTMAQLLPSSKKLTPETLLQPGKPYFLLPYSLFQSETSPANMIAIGTRLAAVANSTSRGSGDKGEKNTSKNTSKDGVMVINDDHKFVFKKYEEQISIEKKSWKPILEAITEKSMERRSEKDLSNMIVISY